MTLTQRAEQQLIVLNALERGELLVAEAATLLGLSSRQVRRIRSLLGPGAVGTLIVDELARVSVLERV